LNRESAVFRSADQTLRCVSHIGERKKGGGILERLVDIDAYDYRNQERMELLRGKVDDAQLKRIASRLVKSERRRRAMLPTLIARKVPWLRLPAAKKAGNCRRWKI